MSIPAVTEAIIAELRRQAQEGEGILQGWIDDELGPERVILDGSFDMGKVAEAAIKAGAA